MLQYPSIVGSAKAPLGKPCIAFYKHDGSNLRWEWSPKKGWSKFGTRTQLFDASDPIYGKAIPIFMDTLAGEVVRRVKDQYRGIERITAFTEYLGPNSFAGKHEPTDPMQLVLFDVFLFKKGFIKPREYVKMFGDLDNSARVVYDGVLNKQFIDDVRRGGVYDLWEGVVAKGDDFTVKIKTDAYFQRLNEVYGTEYRNHWE